MPFMLTFKAFVSMLSSMHTLYTSYKTQNTPWTLLLNPTKSGWCPCLKLGTKIFLYLQAYAWSSFSESNANCRVGPFLSISLIEVKHLVYGLTKALYALELTNNPVELGFLTYQGDTFHDNMVWFKLNSNEVINVKGLFFLTLKTLVKTCSLFSFYSEKNIMLCRSLLLIFSLILKKAQLPRCR